MRWCPSLALLKHLLKKKQQKEKKKYKRNKSTEKRIKTRCCFYIFAFVRLPRFKSRLRECSNKGLASTNHLIGQCV